MEAMRMPARSAYLVALCSGVLAFVVAPPVDAKLSSDPLVGTWDTRPIPMARVRAAAHAAGYSNALITRFFNEIGAGKQKTVETNLQFYRQGGVPYALGTGWDPTQGPMASGGDHGPYKLLPNHRLVLMSADPTNKQRDIYRYRISSGKLTLKAIAETNPAFTPAELHLDSIHLYFQTAAPFKKIR
jgi:hypothetical protein